MLSRFLRKGGIPDCVLRHQFRQDLILGLDLLLQVGDPLPSAEWLGCAFG